ncbi:GumC family protein [Chitinophaga sp. 22321]|uniref:non-specific protein-tyrosine kinase n=1 Tax=Chitinophaga hostae TaxID=2831022 RepID=A0ABS5J112_9BACT|nr:polysaccharide biosynthesis tyrosine autokinase [Chitinophaga hostae]MBS0028845.1 polysaccharide biosynthesis tyrosine autokinase [Chitinophaga hostae]
MLENFNGNGQTAVNVNGVLQQHNEPDKAFDLRKLLDKVLSHWYWFFLCIVAGIALSWLYLRYATPDYKVNAKILIQDDQKGGDSPEKDVLQQLQIFNSKSNVDNEMEIIKSRSLMERTVKDLQLNVSYWLEGRLKTAEQFRKLPFAVQWSNLIDSLPDAEYVVRPVSDNKVHISAEGVVDKDISWNDTLHLPEGIMKVVRQSNNPLIKENYIVRVVSVDKAVTVYRNKLAVNIPNKQVSTIDLTMTSTIPEKGEIILNELINAYMQLSVDAKNRIADSTIAFVDNRLALVSRELSGVEKDIQTFKQNNQLADLGEQAKLLIASTGDFSRQLTEQQVKLSVVESLEKYINDEANNKRIVPSSLVLEDPNFVSIIGKYNGLELERERLLMSNTASNPVVRNIDEQLVSLRGDLKSNLTSFKTGIQTSIAQLQQRSGAIDKKIQQVPAKERVFLDYSRQQAVKQELYLFLLKKREESAISKSSNLAGARIIDLAKSEAFPYMPKRALIYLLGMILGVILPSVGLYLRDVLSRRVVNKLDITENTPAPILAEVGHTDAKAAVIISKDSVTPVAEQFRALRTNLQFVLREPKEKVILLTSSMSGEGKTFIATNLAAVLSLSGKKVLLMEMDLRKPKVSEKLGLDNRTGFSTWAIGKTPLNELVRPSGINDNCWLISSGPIPPNPAELLLTESTKELFTHLRAHFDYIVIDAPPVGLVTDAQLLGTFADATLYLVRQGYTFKQQLQISKELFIFHKMPKMNLIVNDVKAGQGYGYSYSYGYGYGYNSNTKKGLSKRIKVMFGK